MKYEDLNLTKKIDITPMPIQKLQKPMIDEFNSFEKELTFCSEVRRNEDILSAQKPYIQKSK